MAQPIQQKPKDKKKSPKQLKIWENNEAFHKTKSAIKREINKNPVVLHMLETIIPKDNSAHRLSENLLEKVIKNRKMERGAYSKLLSLLFNFKSNFDAEIIIKRNNDSFSMRPVLFNPSLFSFKMKGLCLPSKRIRPFPLSPAGKKKELVNIVKIEDGTDPGDYWAKRPSQFFDIFTEMESKIIPTVVQYTNRKARKLFLLYIPSHLSTTTFNKVYGKFISKIQGEFYGKTYSGRPESKLAMEKRIYWIMKDHWGSRLSINRLCEIAAERLGMKFVTIKRHYKHVIQRVKGAKIT